MRSEPSLARRLALGSSRLFIRCLALLLPRRARSDWREEWEAELLARPDGAGPLLRHARGAVFDAFWHVREEWNADMLAQDLRFALRTLVARPALTAVVVASLAFGIGANAVIYSIVDGVVLNPFSFPEPDRVVGVGAAHPRLGEELAFWEALAAPDYALIKQQATTLGHVAGFDMGQRQIYGGDVPQNLFSAFWWDDPFPAVGMEPFLGRGFTSQDYESEETPAIISHRVWRTRFGGDPSAVGRTILVDGDPYVLVGVMPPGLNIYNTDLWLPMWADPELMPRSRRQFNIIARLAPGATLEQTNVELEGLARRIESAWGAEFEEYDGWRLVASTWTDVNVSAMRPAAIILLTAVGVVLLLVCSNVASLLLVRSAARRREIAVRTALGAGRLRIVRQLLTESLTLALGGGLAGVALAYAGLDAIVSQLTANVLPFQIDVAMNARVLLYCAAASLLAGAVFGLVPALHAARLDPQRALASASGHVAGSASRRRWNATFVVVEVALALTLLVGAGLLIHSFVRLQVVDPGVDIDSVLTMRLTLPWSKYEGEQIPAFFETLAARVAGLPGVESVAAGSQFPPVVFSRAQFWIEGTAPPGEGRLPAAFVTTVGDGYFETLGIPVVRGRALGRSDVAGSRLVGVVNEVVARRFFGDSDPIGRRLKLGPPDSDSPWFEIVGVVASTRNRGLGTAPEPEIFAHIRQSAGSNNQFFLLIRSAVAPRGLLDSVREEVAALDRQQPIYAIQTLEEAFATSIAQQRFAMWALGIFGLVAVGLAGIGIYGIVSWAVSERTREIGVRMALGASRRQLLRQMIRQALVPVVIGLLLGLALAVAMGQALGGLLYEVGGADPPTFVAVAATFLAVALAASWLPARRVSRVDPLLALRAE